MLTKVRAFPIGFLYFLYFIFSKIYFSTSHINFYKTLHIPLSIGSCHRPENLYHQQPKSIAHPMPKVRKPSNPQQVQIINHKPSIHTHNQIKKTQNSLQKPWPPSSIQNHKSHTKIVIITSATTNPWHSSHRRAHGSRWQHQNQNATQQSTHPQSPTTTNLQTHRLHFIPRN
jgi:hypothetical protein